MKKNDLTLKQTFLLAVENYKKRNFPLSEKLCYKILSIDSDHFDSLVLLSNIHAISRNFVKAKELLNKANESLTEITAPVLGIFATYELIDAIAD